MAPYDKKQEIERVQVYLWPAFRNCKNGTKKVKAVNCMKFCPKSSLFSLINSCFLCFLY